MIVVMQNFRVTNDKPEMFYDILNLESWKEIIKILLDQIKFSQNDKPLVYFFFELINLSKSVKEEIKIYLRIFCVKHLHLIILIIILLILISPIGRKSQAY